MFRFHVRLDASFSSVVLAVLVLEGLGRSLDPSIDILTRAIPYLALSKLWAKLKPDIWLTPRSWFILNPDLVSGGRCGSNCKPTLEMIFSFVQFEHYVRINPYSWTNPRCSMTPLTINPVLKQSACEYQEGI